MISLNRTKMEIDREKPTVKASPASIVEVPLSIRKQLLFGGAIGCFVAPDRVHLAAVKHLGTRLVVKAVASHPIPGEVPAEERAAFVGSVAAAFFDECGGRGARVSVAVSGSGTAFRSFLLPALRKPDLAAAVKLEAEKQIPFPVADCHFGFSPVARITSGEQVRLKIALHAATKGVLRQALGPIVKAGLPVRAVHSGPDAIGQLLEQLSDFDPSRTYTVLRIGHRETETAFYRGGTLEFFHHGGTGASMMGDNAEEAHVEFFAETLATEIQTSFDYYAGQHSRQSAPEIYVCGAASGNERLLQILSDRVGYRFTAFPIERVAGLTLRRGFDTEQLVEALPAVATALCRANLVNLLPREQQQYWRMKRADVLGRISVATVLLLLLASWGVFNRDLQVRQSSSIALQRQLAMFQNSTAYHTFNILKSRIAVSSEYIRIAEKEPTYLALNLKEMSNLTPPEIRLTRFDLNTSEPGENLWIHGLVESSQTPPEVVLADFVERLNASGFYENVVVERHVKRRADGVVQMDFQLRMRGII